MKKIFVAALLLTATLAWWFGDGPVLRNQLGIQQGKAAPAPAQYLTAAIEEGELRRVITATGTLNAIVNVEVGSQLSGLYGRRPSGPAVFRRRAPGAQGAAGGAERRHLHGRALGGEPGEPAPAGNDGARAHHRQPHRAGPQGAARRLALRAEAGTGVGRRRGRG